mgnify:CR=1 FL=1
MADEDPEVYATIVSSDRDLLQLISPVVDVKLLKQKDYIRYNPETFLLDLIILFIILTKPYKAFVGNPLLFFIILPEYAVA